MIYIGPPITRDVPGIGLAVCPPAGARAWLDLRTPDQCASRDTSTVCLFQAPDGALDKAGEYTAIDPARLSLIARNRLGTTQATMGDLLKDRLLMNPINPAQPGKGGRVRLNFGGFQYSVLTKELPLDIKASIVAGLRRDIALIDDEQHKLKALSLYLTRNIGVQATRAEALAWLGIDKDPLPPSTTITESFNKADSTTLGPDNTWAEDSGNAEVFSNECRAVTTFVARVTSTVLSSTDASNELDCDYSQNPNNNSAGPIISKIASSELTYYLTLVVGGITGTLEIYRVNSGSFTFIAGGTSGLSGGRRTLKIERSGSDLSAYLGGALDISATTDGSPLSTSYFAVGLRTYTGTGAGSRSADAMNATDGAVTIIDMAALCSASASLSGTPKAMRRFTGATAGTASLTGLARINRGIAGLLNAAGGATGAMRLYVGIGGSIGGNSSLDGALQGTFVALAAAITGASSASGTIRASRSIAGSLSGAGGAAGAIAITMGVSGAAGGTASLDGTLRAVLGIVGQAAGAAALSGTLRGVLGVYGTIGGASTLVGVLRTAANDDGTMEWSDLRVEAHFHLMVSVRQALEASDIYVIPMFTGRASARPS